MIPIELKIKGLYSFKNEQIIDFTTLMESHIFGIFGKVGSGKSSILEAMSFVLYGQSERLNARDNRNYNMMNLQSNELNIEFIFRAGTPKVEYKAIAFAKRNKKRFDDVKKIERKLYRKEKEKWIPIESNEIVSIVGLSYDNFKRAIIIPQGKFQEFLALKSSERSEMLKEIFNLQKFDLSGKIGQLNNQNKEKISHLDGQLAQLSEVSTIRLKEQETALKLLVKINKELESKFKKEQKKLKESEKEKSLFEELSKAEEDANSYVQKYEKRFQEMELEAKNVAYCNQHFKTNLELLAQQQYDVSELESDIAKATKELQEVDNELIKSKDGFEKVKKEYEKKDTYQKIMLDIDKGIERAAYTKTKEQSDKTWADMRQELTNLETKIEALEKEEKQHKTQLKKITKELPNLVELNDIRDWYEIDKDAMQAIASKETDLKSVQADLKEVHAKKQMAVQPILAITPELEQMSIADSKKSLEQKINDVSQQIKKITNNEKVLMTKNALADHASHLKDGEACPVCGSLEHPNILDGDDLAKKLEKIQIELENHQAFLLSGRAVMNALSGFGASELNFYKRIKQINNKIATLQKAKEKHQKTKFWKDKSINSLESIKEKVKQAESIKEKIAELESHITQNDQAIQKAESKLKLLRPQIDKIEKERDQLQSKMDLLKAQIDVKIFNGIQTATKSEMEAMKAKYQRRINENETNFLTREQQLKVLEEKNTTISTTLNLKTKSLNKETKVLEKINQKITTEITKSTFGHLDEVSALLAKNIDPTEQLKRVQNYKNEAFAKQQKWNELKAKTRSLSFDEKKFSELQASLLGQEATIKSKQGMIATTKSLIEDLIKRVATKKLLQNDLKALELRAENIRTLTQLFKGQGFVNFISSVYLQNIVKAANERFKNLTKHELALELAGDNSFSIRDRLNGGKIRNIKTLSGGQTFQAALCLALALADNIHELTKSERNFFFLDEGFGSQDNDAISDVFKTLKALRKENRTVGIISHVDMLQQEIDVHLMVEKDDQKGSVIVQSW